ncbi:MAG: diaminopimelate decarboxylase, partial [Thermoleophilia bacterium]|nr:diaminopimelate decarboxylase [Thermoleophilia bacterium]
ALDNGIGFIVVDSLDEMALLEGMAAERGERQRILLRITPGVEAHTHHYIQTGQLDSKFGFGLAEGHAVAAIRRALDSPHLELVGLHAHIGSQIFELEGFRRAIAILVDLIKETYDRYGFECRYLNVGGGLGIRYTGEDTPVTIDQYVAGKIESVRDEMARVGLPVPRILVEPGRSIVAKAGLTAYHVGSIKEVPGIRTYVSVDGGMSDNMRPMLYDAVYEAMIADRACAPAHTVVTVAGKHCESSDILIKDATIAQPRVGDILVTPVTGAYCFSMASNYNGNPRPAVLLVNDGRARVIVERESYADLVARQRPLHG